jgi:hypothetical protein
MLVARETAVMNWTPIPFICYSSASIFAFASTEILGALLTVPVQSKLQVNQKTSSLDIYVEFGFRNSLFS